MRRATTLIFSCAVFVLPLACFDDEPTPDDQADTTGGECPGAGGCECASNDECDNGVLCEAGLCNYDECMSFGDCPDDAPICVQGLCEPCVESADACPAGTSCVEGMCVAP